MPMRSENLAIVGINLLGQLDSTPALLGLPESQKARGGCYAKEITRPCCRGTLSTQGSFGFERGIDRITENVSLNYNSS